MTNDSATPISRPPSIAPGIEPIPPTTAAVNALSPAMNPIVAVTWLNSSPPMIPATPAKAEPRKNVAVMTKFTLMPSISAASRSAATARIRLPSLVNRTRLGRQMRAVAADREAAEMLGINVNFVITATFFLGSALAGVAGIMGGLLFNQVTATIGFIAGLKAFTAAVVGGIGSIPGAMLGGLVIGVAESFVTGYISSTYSNLIVFGILIVVMLLRPTGLLGRAQLQKV